MSLVGTRPILQDELRQYELHHRRTSERSVFFSEFCSFFNSSFKWAKESNEELTDFTNNCSQKLIQSSSLAALEFKSIVLSM